MHRHKLLSHCRKSKSGQKQWLNLLSTGAPVLFESSQSTHTAKALALVIWTSLAQTVCGNFSMPAMAAQADNPTVQAQIDAAQEVQSLVIKPGTKPAIDCSEVDFDGLQVTIWQQAGQVDSSTTGGVQPWHLQLRQAFTFFNRSLSQSRLHCSGTDTR
jgi:hypothetical protein